MGNSIKKKVIQSKKDYDQLIIERQAEPKLLDAKKFAGTIKWKGDPLKLQREWRDE